MTDSKREIIPAASLPAATKTGLVSRGLRLLQDKNAITSRVAWEASKAKLLPYLLTFQGPEINCSPDVYEEMVTREAGVGAGLCAALVENEPDTIVYTARHKLATWEVSEEEAWTTAFQNLEAHLQDIIMVLREPGFIQVLGWKNPQETDFAATLILCQALRTTLCEALHADRCVVSLPNRDLLFAMNLDYHGLDQLVDYCRQQALLRKYGVSRELFMVHRSGAWQHMDVGDGFLRAIGRPFHRSSLDEPYMGLPDIWGMRPYQRGERWVHYDCGVYSVEHPLSWRVERDRRITNLIRPESGAVTISWHTMDPGARPVQLHQVRSIVEGTGSEFAGYRVTLAPRARLMSGWAGVYMEFSAQEPIPLQWLILGACCGHTIVMLTAQEDGMGQWSKLEYLRVFNSLQFRH
jgi:hypothetical protein